MATAAPPMLERNPIPPTELSLRPLIWFLHPGYPDGTNSLLTLPRVDRISGTPGTPDTFGVHHRTALVACQIVANNAFDTGVLALDKAGERRVDTPPDGILTEEKYYLIVDGDSRMYSTSCCLPRVLTLPPALTDIYFSSRVSYCAQLPGLGIPS
jgi:hypothetical protein